MTFLPIVERELRVAARKRSTFWVRIIAALVALVIGGGFLVMSTMAFGLGSASLGRGLFATLTWLGLAACLSAGLFFTSDCLSEEKREGTIGFLFLTDLRGYDVVLGKLLATSLRGVYALLAVFPILAVTLLMGGVTGAQFWKTALALVNALFLSLAAGLFVSSISRDAQKALAATLLLLMLIVAGGPAGDAFFSVVSQRSFQPALSLSSPGYLFVAADAWGASPFWSGLLVNQVVAWLLLGLTCGLLPRSWQEKAAKHSAVRDNRATTWKFGGAKSRAALRQKLIEVNPVLWLACRERWQAALFWVVAIFVAVGVAATFAETDQMNQSGMWMYWGFFGGVVTLVLYLGIASQAGRFFVEAKRSGLLELLLTTPLTAKQMVQGQWRALLRMFGLPLALYLAAQLTSTVMSQQSWRRVATAAPSPPTVTTTNATTNAMIVTTTRRTPMTTTTTTVSVGGFTAPSEWATLAASVAGTLVFVANLAALSWFGMWMGLNSRNTNLATLKTIVFVQIIPWIVITFGATMCAAVLIMPRMIQGGAAPASQMTTWFPLITTALTTALVLAKDIAFVFWARRKLLAEFRERAMQAVAPIRPSPPPPLPRAETPPVIAPT
jgi:hypothetical protein